VKGAMENKGRGSACASNSGFATAGVAGVSGKTKGAHPSAVLTPFLPR